MLTLIFWALVALIPIALCVILDDLRNFAGAIPYITRALYSELYWWAYFKKYDLLYAWDYILEPLENFRGKNSEEGSSR